MICRACFATRASWVTMMMVMPSCALSCSNMLSTSSLVRESRLPVGSSAKISGGWLTSARAMATRCCWPPESWEGSWSMRSSRPTRRSISRACCRAWRSERWPAVYESGIATFSRALVRGSRLKFWKTKPNLWLRTRARWSLDRDDTFSPSSQYSPEVGRSRQPRMFISVLLPDPEAPIRATSSPRATVTETPLSTGTSMSPSWYVL